MICICGFSSRTPSSIAQCARKEVSLDHFMRSITFEGIECIQCLLLLQYQLVCYETVLGWRAWISSFGPLCQHSSLIRSGYENWKKSGILFTALTYCNIHEEIKVDDHTPFFITEMRKRQVYSPCISYVMS